MTRSERWKHMIPQAPRKCINCGNDPLRKARTQADSDYVYKPFRELPRHLYLLRKVYPWLDEDDFAIDELQKFYDMISWNLPKVELNRRTFIRFLRYHNVEAKAPYGANRILFNDGTQERDQDGNIKLVPPSSVSFMDDGNVLVYPTGQRVTISIWFAESRLFYKRLAAYISLPYLEVTDRL